MRRDSLTGDGWILKGSGIALEADKEVLNNNRSMLMDDGEAIKEKRQRAM